MGGLLYFPPMTKTVEEIASLIGGQVIGNGKISVSGITNIENPLSGHITFVQDEKALKGLEASEIACLIVSPQVKTSAKPLIQVPHPKLAWAQLLRHFFPAVAYSKKISQQAFISKTAKIG